ncbi:Uncharacterized HTH-type transcriptional regulator y4tD [Bosea sp. 62]|uniref:Lrp/AsnC family transcriptional regulator n=1 Tax=unclassified Bosea (in: a-proteobacteria) TaxID=2653178 RepID=UPI00125690FF|nr:MULTISPECIES: Lrp/AsnC family transcriptional regulator [unclassified Bosea (in: a-proteobacteria)]CAD5255108.1 Uncharacterized HTH-type transcriptional regulator y4tD [Bosea sp. 21B]CAD5285205.1 Uncharacterized HTH-type transcriptional regulator y4tD [Bosea sp. 7B]CAD5301572.1 Uncharacterized HTH-type transcriptional regulator y4tD [Bosea sp. 46]VVT57689.1 Uncharacterized HTH-type transcriptional regulator y4tD [Bosea sp. EC-HK365B]VXB29573.1 Uncharacterized HTH-type transcriptional regula
MIELDRIDRRILATLQDDNRLTNLELARRVGVSPPVCLRRVRRLRDAKVIEGDVSLINPEAFGPQTTVIAQVKLVRGTSDVVQGFKRAMLDRPEVTQCYLVTGPSDFVIIIQVADVAEYERFLEGALYRNPHVDSIASSVVVNRVKFRPAPLRVETGGNRS